MTRLRITHTVSSVRRRVQELTEHHGNLRAAAAAVGVSTDTLSRILRHERATVQEPTYQAITRAHATMLRAQKRRDAVAGEVVADFATTPEGRAFIAECRGAA